MSSPIIIYTVGHSTHTIEKFFDLLERNGVTAIADVRSSPFSRHNPQFHKDTLSAELKKRGIAYVFVGKELGARPDDPSCYERGKVRYARLAKSSLFKAGIERVLSGAQKYRIALMCAEKEPLDCHRTLLVSRALEQRGVSVVHILADGSTESQEQTMSRLVDQEGLRQLELFRSYDKFRIDDQLVARACEKREERIAYVDQ
jgi:uncharacterized protein (DUF488 family)